VGNDVVASSALRDILVPLRPMRALGAACAKTPARFHTNLFRSLFGGLKAFRIGKIAKNSSVLDRLQNFVEFPHSLGG
jgi:hypothetical protein